MTSWRLLEVVTMPCPPPRQARSRRHLACRSRGAQGSVDRNLEGRKGFGQTRLVMGRADEPGLARIRLAQNPLIVQDPGRGIVEGVVAALPVTIVARRLVRKVQPAHGRVAHKAVRDPP